MLEENFLESKTGEVEYCFGRVKAIDIWELIEDGFSVFVCDRAEQSFINLDDEKVDIIRALIEEIEGDEHRHINRYNVYAVFDYDENDEDYWEN